MDSALNHLLALFAEAIKLQPGRLHALAVLLFERFVELEIVFFLVMLLINYDHRKNSINHFFSQIIGLNFFFYLVLNGPWFTKMIVDSFMKVGGRAAGTGALDPATVLD